MADHFTTRLQIPYPDIDDPADVPADMQQLAERLDVLIPAGSGAGSVLNRVTVGDVGTAGQIRAGRALTLADFTALGLSAPAGLWNLSDLTDVSGSNRPLTNKGAVTFAPGINGLAATAAQFTGSAAQALYIVDTGAADPLRIKTGTIGFWFKTAKRSAQTIMSRLLPPALAWMVQTNTSVISVNVSVDGASWGVAQVGSTDVCDDRWHFVSLVIDGTAVRVYIDGTLEFVVSMGGTMAAVAAPLNIGGYGADAANPAVYPHFGRVDEAFVTADVLSEDQVRALYCARLPHTYAAVPSGVKLNVTRRRRGGALAVADFSAQPLRLHNFTGGTLADQGSNALALTNGTGTLIVAAAGADGTANNAYSFTGAHAGLTSTDAGLPAALASRSYGCWFKIGTVPGGSQGVIAWGTTGTADARLWVYIDGMLYSQSGGDTAGGTRFVCDGQWHFSVVVEDNAPIDGVKRKLYLDGRLVGTSTGLNAIALLGANRFRVGAFSDGTGPLIGQVDGAFVCGYAMDASEIARLYAKGSLALSPSPKNPGDHVEGWDATAVYATFDTLDSQWQVDLGVAA